MESLHPWMTSLEFHMDVPYYWVEIPPSWMEILHSQGCLGWKAPELDDRVVSLTLGWLG